MRKPTLKLPKGSSITDPTTGSLPELSAAGFVDMDDSPAVTIPANTDLFIPGKGKVKASSGTEVKAKSKVGAKKKGEPTPSVEIELPACTLREPSNGGATTELSAGTKVRTKQGKGSILVLADIRVSN